MILLFDLSSLCLMSLSEKVADQVSSDSNQGGHHGINAEYWQDQVKRRAFVSNIYD